MRTFLAWVVGIAAFGFFTLLLSEGAKLIGVPTYIDFGETITVTHGFGRNKWDTEESGASTRLGFSINIIAFVLGIWLGGSVYTGTLIEDASNEGRRSVISFLIFFSVYGIGGAILWTMFGRADGALGIVSNVLELTIAAVAFLLARKAYFRKGYTFEK